MRKITREKDLCNCHFVGSRPSFTQNFKKKIHYIKINICMPTLPRPISCGRGGIPAIVGGFSGFSRSLGGFSARRRLSIL